GRVGNAAGERLLGEVLTVGVAEGAAGELLGAGDARGAVAPGRPAWVGLAGLATPQIVDRNRLRPPRPMACLLLPGVEPLADAGDGLGMAVDGDAVAEGEREQRERSSDAVGDSVVAVAAGWRWL